MACVASHKVTAGQQDLWNKSVIQVVQTHALLMFLGSKEHLWYESERDRADPVPAVFLIAVTGLEWPCSQVTLLSCWLEDKDEPRRHNGEGSQAVPPYATIVHLGHAIHLFLCPTWRHLKSLGWCCNTDVHDACPPAATLQCTMAGPLSLPPESTLLLGMTLATMSWHKWYSTW